MTANYRDSRLYNASRRRIFEACRDAIQPCGFLLKSTDPDTFTVEAFSPYREAESKNAGLFEELASLAFDRLFSERFGESITLNVDEEGRVHAVSVSRPKTTLLDQGVNRENILAIWKKMDEYLRRPSVVHHNSVNIDGDNTGVVQQDSAGDVHQTGDSGSRARGSSRPDPTRSPRDEDGRWQVGIITVLREETQAVRLALDLDDRRIGALRFYEGEAGPGRSPAKVVATQALEQGNRSTMAAYENLRRRYDPEFFVLVGVGGSIRPEIPVGDVVVASRIVYYDLRKKTPEGTQHRGEERAAPSAVGHAVNAFFTDHDFTGFEISDPSGAVRHMRMWPGLIGSGDAVIADEEADVLKYLAAFNDKVLAVDTQSGGLAAACHEQSADSGKLQGWLVVRGISDDDHRRLASWHAAVALKKLLPYLAPLSR
jgi:adenosylhomocysteine nucleosidase